MAPRLTPEPWNYVGVHLASLEGSKKIKKLLNFFCRETFFRCPNNPNFVRNRSSVLEIYVWAPKNIKIRAVATKLQLFARERTKKKRRWFWGSLLVLSIPVSNSLVNPYQMTDLWRLKTCNWLSITASASFKSLLAFQGLNRYCYVWGL